jgi:hypothetical protein
LNNNNVFFRSVPREKQCSLKSLNFKVFVNSLISLSTLCKKDKVHSIHELSEPKLASRNSGVSQLGKSNRKKAWVGLPKKRCLSRNLHMPKSLNTQPKMTAVSGFYHHHSTLYTLSPLSSLSLLTGSLSLSLSLFTGTLSLSLSNQKPKTNSNPYPIGFIIRGKVYNVTKFLDEHPGGAEVMLEQAGKVI